MRWKFEKSSLIKELELDKSPVVITVNKFNEESAKEFKSKMALAHNTGQKIIPVVIDSYGGEVYSLLSMISSINNSDLPVSTIVEGKAMSCGAILFSFGEDGLRFMDKDATVMIHDVSSGVIGKVEDMKVSVEEAERLNKKVFKMMARNIGKSDEYFLKKIKEKGHTDWYLDAEETKKIGLANQIRVPVLNIKVSVDIELE